MKFISIVMDCNTDQLLILATKIAIELAKGKDFDELNTTKNLVSHIASCLHFIICQRALEKGDKKNKKD